MSRRRLRRVDALWALAACLWVSLAGPASGGPDSPAAPPSGTWSTIAAGIRYFHAASLLQDGKVLVTGGCTQPRADGPCLAPTDATELYDPASQRWTAGTPMGSARLGHTSVVLSDGRVLVAGGCAQTADTPFYVCVKPAGTPETFDPRRQRWEPTSPPALPLATLAIGDQNATLLPPRPRERCGDRCGQVLLTGLSGAPQPFVSQLYDPATDHWATTSEPAVDLLSGHTATLLTDGRVLVRGSPPNRLPQPSLPREAGSGPGAGGAPGPPSAAAGVTVLFDPRTGRWNTGAPDDIGRDFPTATRLPDGAVLIAGGLGSDGTSPVASSELFYPGPSDPSHSDVSGRFLPTGSLAIARFGHAPVPLGDGSVLVTGGSSAVGRALAAAELYDPVLRRWRRAGTMGQARGGTTIGPPEARFPTAAPFTSTLLEDGSVLVLGGTEAGTADLYRPEGMAQESSRAGSALWVAVVLGGVGLLALAVTIGSVTKRRRR